MCVCVCVCVCGEVRGCVFLISNACVELCSEIEEAYGKGCCVKRVLANIVQAHLQEALLTNVELMSDRQSSGLNTYASNVPSR